MTKAEENTISPHIVYGGFVAVSVVLALIAHILPETLRLVVNGQNGIFENLTVLFYAMAVWLAGRQAWARRAQGWKRYGLWAAAGVLAFIFIGEEFRWGIPYLYPDFREWPIISLQSILARAYEGVQEGQSLKLIAIIAATRMAGIMAVIYAVAGAFYYRKQLRALKIDWKNPAVIYGVIFLGLFALAILWDAKIMPGRKIFEECCEMLAAGAFVMGVFSRYSGGDCPELDP